MKRTLFVIVASLAVFSLTGCSRSLFGTLPPFPTYNHLSSPTPLSTTPVVPTIPPATSQPNPTDGSAPTATSLVAPIATTGANQPGGPSGPYGVIQVAPGDVLNIHSAAGSETPVSGSFPATANNVMRSGPSSNVGGAQWVQVQNPAGGLGWVNAAYLTEFITPTAFCADPRVNALLAGFGNAVKTANGVALSSSVSPVHGMTVLLWRNGNAVVFDQSHAQWLFTSTFEHHWGAAPGSGLDTVGAFHGIVLPKWLDVLNSSFTLSCDTPQTGGASYDTSWPAIYANVNFYSIYKPGPSGNELSWRTLLVGVEYVKAQPYIFSVMQMNWEP
jgi:hypothetical protein